MYGELVSATGGLLGAAFMPYSSSVYDHWIENMVALLQPATVLDIGPGAGKYGRIVKDTAAKVGFGTQVRAVEIDGSYVEEFKLRDIYDEVIVADALSLMTQVQLRYDLVIIGDCIEHLRKSDGIDLLNFLIYRSGYICVVTPEQYLQDDVDGHAAEAHISTWSPYDFAGWDVLHHFWEKMHMFLIKGYLPTRVRITG